MSSPSLTGLSPNNPLKYLGPNVSLNIIVTRKREPTGADIKQPETGKYYSFGTQWLVGKNPTTGVFGDLWFLSKIENNVAFWVQNGADFTILTQNATPQFVQTGNDVIINFGLTNLLLGAPGTSITSATFNTGYGQFALESLTTGLGNTVIGSNAGTSISTDNENTYIGDGAGFSRKGDQNTYVGAHTSPNGTGTDSVIVGFNGGFNMLAGSRNILLGSGVASAYTTSESNNIIIGNIGVITDHNIIRIGTQGSSSGQQDTCFIAGIVANTVLNAQSVVINSVTGQLGITLDTFTRAFGTAYVQRTTSHQMLITNSIVGILNTSVPRTVTMPNAGMTVGQQWIVKDESGNAGTNAITVDGNGVNIDGAATSVITTNYGTISLYWNGTQFFTF